MVSAKQFALEIAGPFLLTDSDGRTIMISSKKSRALLAILALSPRGERSRTSLQDLLWSRVERAEAQNSLRRELSNLRAALGYHGHVLIEADSLSVRLRRDLVWVDVADGDAPKHENRVLLEGLDLAGEDAFEDWLRQQRAPSMSEARGNCTAVVRDLTKVDPKRPTVGITPPMLYCDDRLQTAIAASLDDLFIATLSETGLVDIVDYRLDGSQPTGAETKQSGPDVFLSLRITGAGPHSDVTVQVTRIADGVVLLLRRMEIGRDAKQNCDEPTAVFVREVSDQLLWILAHGREWQQRPKHQAARHAFCAVDQMFSLKRKDVLEAERNLAESLALSPQSTTYAWRAYRSVFLIDEPGSLDVHTMKQDIFENERKALELDPYNGLSLSLLAHVRSFILRDFQTAGDYLDRARSLGSDHVMFHDSAAMLSFYFGDFDNARRSAERSDVLGRHLPYRYSFATSLCMIYGLQGKFLQAIAHGERAMRLQPPGAQKVYPPALRYLGASYAAVGMHDEASRTFLALAAIDPLANSRNIQTARYPTPSEQAACFIREGLSSVGM